MHLIKVNAINSTNSFARELFKENKAVPVTCILAKKQLQGRGQRGTTWESEEGQNLTFSVLYPHPGIPPANQFLLSAAVAAALVQGLQKFGLPKLKVKWPNDILSANNKIAGILIENVITEGQLTASIIGIGLNVNQEQFPHLPAAGSMYTVSGKKYEPQEVLDVLLNELENRLDLLSNQSAAAILQDYKDRLFRFGIPSTFERPDASRFTGIIAGVKASGELIVRTEDDLLQEFDLKEIKLCY
ncbi:biotin--[acetyl-CoA-carboxylase] ligase [Salinimicrobium flavum]|uniref:Biotin--[acetyl-CoA-carboxylase] ligase n=1 Tax=Salinimicrobium flavum TaxID=1737065 RepID=A0ABW5IVB2_9FLAO